MCGRFGTKAWVWNGEDWVCVQCGKPTLGKGFYSVRGFEIFNPEVRFFDVSDVCDGRCFAREHCLNRRSMGDYGFAIIQQRDQDFYDYCPYCHRIYMNQLVQCPDCSCFFKGPKKFFPVDYECDNCG